jgi:23S rRNA pseudouridine2605 synthase
MPPRYAYWTILAGGLPTAFRAAEKDELLPTFKRIQEKQPDAVMKFFARGKLWDSPEQALRAEAGPRGKGPEYGDSRDRPEGRKEQRDRDWRPGGEHRDPRQPFKDAKKARNQEWRQERWDRKHQPPRERPHGDPLRGDVPPARREPWRDRESGGGPHRESRGGPHRESRGGPQRDQGGGGYRDKGWKNRPPSSAASGFDRKNRDDRDRRPPRERPHGDPLRDDVPPARRESWRDREPARPRSPQTEFRGKREASGYTGKRDSRAPGGNRDNRGFVGNRENRGYGGTRDNRGFGGSRDNRGSAGTGGNRGFGGPTGGRRFGQEKSGRFDERRGSDQKRTFRPKSEHGQEPPPPPRPRGPNREPRPGQEPPPEPPPRPTDPIIPSPPPERGEKKRKKSNW